MDQDRELAVLRAAYRRPWKFERTGDGRIRATHLGYSVTGDNAGQVGRAVVEWMNNAGLTGDSGTTVEQLGAQLGRAGF